MARNPKGRVEQHMQGVGPLSPADVEERARELAVINGGDGSNPTDEERDQALKELRNETLNLSTDDSTEEPLIVESGSRLAADMGHKIEDGKPVDTERIAEMEVLEGLSEAEHDTLLTARDEAKRNK